MALLLDCALVTEKIGSCGADDGKIVEAEMYFAHARKDRLASVAMNQYAFSVLRHSHLPRIDNTLLG